MTPMSLSALHPPADLGKVQTFLPPHLAQACHFLISNEASKGGWPALPGTEISLYHTAVVTCSLSVADFSGYESHIVRAIYRARERFGQDIDALGIVDLSHLLRISSAEGTPDREWVDTVTNRLINRVQEEMLHPHKIRIRDFTAALIALDHAGATAKPTLTKGVKLLQDLETPGTGSWPHAAGGHQSVVVSALVLKALNQIDSQGLTAVVRRCTSYLQANVTERGWHRIGVRDGDIFAQATVLRALAKSGAPALVEQGVTHVEALINPSGGWGPAVGEPSAIEVTAIALDALVACGESRFVTYRSAAANVAAVDARRAELEKQLADLNLGLEERLNRRQREVLADRNNLRQEVDRLRAESRDLEKQKTELQRRALEDSYRARTMTDFVSRQRRAETSLVSSLLSILISWLSIVVVVFSIFVIGSTKTGLLWPAGPPGSIQFWYALLASGLAFGTLVGIKSFLDYPRSGYTTWLQFLLRGSSLSSMPEEFSRSLIKDPYGISNMVLTFADITSFLDPSSGEEFAYMVATRLLDMPPDIGIRYVESFLSRLDTPRRNAGRVMSWVVSFLQLDSGARRVIADQIRRQALIP